MTHDEFSREVWLEEYEHVPDALQRALRLAPRERRFSVLFELGQELGLRMDYASAATYRALDSLRSPLVAALEEGTYILDTRPIELARTVAGSLDLSEATAAMIQLGWGNDQLDRPQVRSLQDDVRKQLARRLHPAIQRMMLRWEHRGVFGRAAS